MADLSYCRHARQVVFGRGEPTVQARRIEVRGVVDERARIYRSGSGAPTVPAVPTGRETLQQCDMVHTYVVFGPLKHLNIILVAVPSHASDATYTVTAGAF